MSKVYAIEVYKNLDPSCPPERAYLGRALLHHKDSLACFSHAATEDAARAAAERFGKTWQAEWDAGEVSRAERLQKLAQARERKAKKAEAVDG